MSDARLIGSVTGLTKASWGTGQAGANADAHGYVYKCVLRRAGEDDKVFDGAGFTIGQIFFDDQDEVEFEILAKDAAALPVRGGILEFVASGAAVSGNLHVIKSGSPDTDLTTWKGVIQGNPEKSWGYKEWKMLKIKATKFANMTFPA